MKKRGFESPSCIEFLESRIAPATLYLSGAAGDLLVRNSSGAFVTGDAAAASTAGANFAIPLAAGDVLIFDVNGNHITDASDFPLVTANHGMALVFVTDVSGDSQFQETEVTGLAVSDGFAGKIGTNVNGSIVTALDASGNFTAANGSISIQAASIAGLNIRGQVVGNIFAGNSISNVTVEARPSISISDVRLPEGNSGTTDFVFHVTLDHANNQAPVTVHYSTANGTGEHPATANNDYVSIPDSVLIFNPGETDKTITVKVNGDTTAENDETFSVNLSAINANISKSQGTGTILNDDAPAISISDVRLAEGNSGTTDFGFHVMLDHANSNAVTVRYSTSDGTATTADKDYAPIPDTALTFNPGETDKIITVKVNGDTTPESNENFTVNLSQPINASINKSQGTGTILDDDSSSAVPTGAIMSSKNVSATYLRSVTGNIATGTAVNIHDPHLIAPGVSFDGGKTILDVGLFKPAAGTPGGSISNVWLDHGAHNLITGNGGNNNLGVPGAGGKILNVAITMDSSDPVWLMTGNGGSSATGFGAAGGSISNVAITMDSSDPASDFEVIAGSGGGGGNHGSGGAGGSIVDCNFLTSGSVAGLISIQSGQGGIASGSGTGGAGGTISGTSAQLLGSANDVDMFSALAGNGGDSATGHGGTGGAIIHSTFIAEAAIDTSFQVTGGTGGTGKIGGNGGQINDAIIHHGVAAALTIAAGDGADANAGSNAGGAGGAAVSVQIFGHGATGADVTLRGGNGGVASSAGKGGHGGNVIRTTIHEIDSISSLTVQGGNGPATTGGDGGDVHFGTFLFGDVDGSGASSGVHILGGDAGDSSPQKGFAGGSVLDVDLKNFGSVLDGIEMKSGHGGSGTSGGGSAGAIARVNVSNIGGVTGGLTIASADGGDAGARGAGGTGGTLTHLALQNFAALSDATISTGTGGAGGSTSGAGGIGGIMNDIELHDPFGNASFLISSGDGGAAQKSGGHGGLIENVAGSIGIAVIDAGNGGDSTNGSGGSGGAVLSIHLTAFDGFVRAVKAGNGGNGKHAGSGGSVSNVTVAGDIGDFQSNFDVVSDVAGMGGIVAGEKGTGKGAATNGAISKISADRIAAMIAGRPAADAIGYGNAVRKISGIHAAVIGADVNGNHTFDFSEGGANAIFEPDDAHHPTDGDTAKDGLVLVKAGGLGALPAAPLKLVQV